MGDVITMAMVREAAKAWQRASLARKTAEEGDGYKTIALLAVFEPLLGIKSEAELKQLCLADVLRTAKRRLESGAVKLHGITAERLLNSIELAATRRNLSWKDAFISALGESRAQELIDGAAESHSYRLLFPA